MKRATHEYQGTLHAVGEEFPAVLPGGWEYAGHYVRQGEDPEGAPFLLASWRRPLPTPSHKSYDTP